MDFRFDLIHDKHETISGPGQYGNCFDDWGNRFVCDNRHHLRHIVLPSRYVQRNPFLAVPDVVQDTSILEPGPLSSGGRVYPLSKNWTTSSLHAGRFTAACGVCIYRGTLLPPEYGRKRDLGAGKIGRGLGRNRDQHTVARRNQRSSAHQPDQYDAKHGGHNACDPQRRLRAFQRRCRQAFRRARKRGEKESLDHEHETDRNDELVHLCPTGAVLASVADLTFLSVVPRVICRNVKSKATLES